MKWWMMLDSVGLIAYKERNASMRTRGIIQVCLIAKSLQRCRREEASWRLENFSSFCSSGWPNPLDLLRRLDMLFSIVVCKCSVIEVVKSRKCLGEVTAVGFNHYNGRLEDGTKDWNSTTAGHGYLPS